MTQTSTASRLLGGWTGPAIDADCHVVVPSFEAIAAHLEPEILMMDEVLAVGDAAFQHKCLDKMNAIRQQGRTILFVSHDGLLVMPPAFHRVHPAAGPCALSACNSQMLAPNQHRNGNNTQRSSFSAFHLAT